MSKGSTTMNYSDMISCLRDDLQSDYRVFDTYKDDIHLPIDLFCEPKEKGSTQPKCAVIVASVKNITKDFQKKLMFYQYYISLNHNPMTFQIILAVPHYAKVDKYPCYEPEDSESTEDFYQKNGFGLWFVNGKNGIDKSQYPAITLGDRINKDFIIFIKKKNAERKESIEIEKKKTFEEAISSFDIHHFVDHYIHDSVIGIARYNPPKFNERYLDGTLLEKTLKIKNKIFQDCLFDEINNHLSEKGDDFEFATKILCQIWGECAENERYPELHLKFEPLLKEIFPKYRDHYIHQFQVFLLGALILDGLHQNDVKIKQDFESLSKGWMLASIFHDVNYPVQKHDEYISNFFQQALGIKSDLGILELKSDYTQNKFSSIVEHLISQMSKCFNQTLLTCDNSIEKLNEVRQFFYYRITKSKNHGALGGIGLIKKLENDPQIDFNEIILPAATAIALHDDDVWIPLHGLKKENDDSNEEWIEKVRNSKPLEKINFEKFPLAFLLIFCDNIQDWGRHYKDPEREKQVEEANIRLKDIAFFSNEVKIQLYFTNTRKSRDLMHFKEHDLERLESVLSSPKIKFTIEYWDRMKNEESGYKCSIN